MTAAALAAIFLTTHSVFADPPAKPAASAESALKESGIELALGDLEAARLLASQAVELDSANPRGYLQRAVVELQLKAFDQAVKDANRAVALGFRKASVFNVRSEALAGQGLYTRALADAEIAVAANPASGAGFLNRALAKQGLNGARADALADFKRAAELDRRYKPQYDAATFALKKGPENGKVVSPVPVRAVVSHGQGWLNAGRAGWASAALVLLVLLVLDWRRRRSRRVRFASVITLPPESDDPRPGSVLGGRFIIGRRLEGIDAFEGRDLEDRPRVLRRYALPRDASRRALALERARLAAGIKSPNLEEIDAVVEERDRFYAACAPVPGEPLHRFASRFPARRVPADQALRVFSGICGGLEAARAKNLAHGALSMTTVCVERQAAVVAELAAPREADARADLFALGCVLYELLAGQSPFPGPDAERQKLEGKFTPLAQALPGAAPGLEGFFARALDPEPERRFRTPSEFFTAFKSVVVPLVQ